MASIRTISVGAPGDVWPLPPCSSPFTLMALPCDTLMLNSGSFQRRQQSLAISEISLHTDRKLSSSRRTWSWKRSVEMTVHFRRCPSNVAPYRCSLQRCFLFWNLLVSGIHCLTGPTVWWMSYKASLIKNEQPTMYFLPQLRMFNLFRLLISFYASSTLSFCVCWTQQVRSSNQIREDVFLHAKCLYLLPGKSKEAEIKRINKELANIRSKFKGMWANFRFGDTNLCFLWCFRFSCRSSSALLIFSRPCLNFAPVLVCSEFSVAGAVCTLSDFGTLHCDCVHVGLLLLVLFLLPPVAYCL